MQIAKQAKTIYSIAYKYVDSYEDAQDVVQDVYLKIYDSKKKFKNEHEENLYTIKAVINEAKNYNKRFWKKEVMAHSLVDISEKEIPSSESVNVNSFDFTCEDLYEKINKMQDMYRLPILYLIDGKSNNEIAKLLNTNPSTIRTRIERGRKTLKNSLGLESYYEKLK